MVTMAANFLRVIAIKKNYIGATPTLYQKRMFTPNTGALPSILRAQPLDREAVTSSHTIK